MGRLTKTVALLAPVPCVLAMAGFLGPAAVTGSHPTVRLLSCVGDDWNTMVMDHGCGTGEVTPVPGDISPAPDAPAKPTKPTKPV
jgi:hypothetical protein